MGGLLELPAPLLGGEEGPPLISLAILLRATGPGFVADASHSEMVGWPPADEEVDLRFRLEVLLSVLGLECDLPEIGRLTVPGHITKLPSDEVRMKSSVPLPQER